MFHPILIAVALTALLACERGGDAGLGGGANVTIGAGVADPGAPAPLPVLSGSAPQDPEGSEVKPVMPTEEVGDAGEQVSVSASEHAVGGSDGRSEIAPGRGTLVGRVLDPAGRPAAGAAVVAWRVDERFDAVKRWRAVRDVVNAVRERGADGIDAEKTQLVYADDDGEYRLRCDADRALLLIGITEHLHVHLRITAAADRERAQDLAMPTPPEVALRGTIRGMDGTPLVGASIAVGWAEGRAVDAVSGAEGAFAITRLFPYLDGRPVVRITVGADGHDTVVLELHAYDPDYLRLTHLEGEVEEYELVPVGRDSFELSCRLEARPDPRRSSDN